MENPTAKLKTLLEANPGYEVRVIDNILHITQHLGDHPILYSIYLGGLPAKGAISKLAVVVQSSILPDDIAIEFMGEQVITYGSDNDMLDDEAIIYAVQIGAKLYAEYLSLIGNRLTGIHILCRGRVYKPGHAGDGKIPIMGFKQSSVLSRLRKIISFCEKQIKINQGNPWDAP